MSWVATGVIAGGSALASWYGAKRQADATKDAANASTKATVEAAQIAADAQQKALETQIAAQKEATAESVAAAQRARDEAIAAIQRANVIAEEAVRSGADLSNAEFAQAYDTITTQLTPWVQTGVQANQRVNALMGFEGPEAAKNALMTDPSYQFRLKQGQQALERSAAGKGNLFSGNTGVALTQYGQDMASQEFTNAFNRLMTLSSTGLDATNTQGAYRWNLAGEKSRNTWNVQNQVGQNALNEANTRTTGAWNVSNAQAGGAQNTANVAIQGARDTANVAGQNAANIANARTNAANANALAVGQQWAGINNAINNAAGIGAMAYGMRNPTPTYSYGSTYGGGNALNMPNYGLTQPMTTPYGY